MARFRPYYLVFPIVAASILGSAAGLKARTTSAPAGRLIPMSYAVFFSPRGGCTAAAVKEIQAARETILVRGYSFTSVPIAQALIDASRRGVAVEAVLDKSDDGARVSPAVQVMEQAFPVLIDDRHAIAHSKIIEIDDSIILTGSFNWTVAAENSNAENLLVLRNFLDLAASYKADYLKHRAHSRRPNALAHSGQIASAHR